MTRRDYVRIAAALAQAHERLQRIGEGQRGGIMPGPWGASFGLQIAAETLADALAADNPRFDRDKFLAAATEGGAA